MEKKNDTHVWIQNREFVISGFESAEYMQTVATYLNTKMEELRSSQGFKNLDRDVKNIMLDINISDDYFKAKAKADELEADLKAKEEELYNLKHEFIAMKSKMGKMKEELNEVGQSYEAAQRKLDKLAVIQDEDENKA